MVKVLSVGTKDALVQIKEENRVMPIKDLSVVKIEEGIRAGDLVYNSQMVAHAYHGTVIKDGKKQFIISRNKNLEIENSDQLDVLVKPTAYFENERVQVKVNGQKKIGYVRGELRKFKKIFVSLDGAPVLVTPSAVSKI